MRQRKDVLDEITGSLQFDIAVIGGGASGIGAALEAALRGYKTVLFDRSDFAKGTSSRSTKLIHGGVRYLAQGDLKMVREALKERGYLLQNAPHLVHNQPFVIPVYRWWDAILYTIGLTFYDLLAGRYSLGRSIFINRQKALELLPGIVSDKLKGGVRYFDGQFDDSRLAMDMLHAFDKEGGMALNYCPVTGLMKDDTGRINGVKIYDIPGDETYNVPARAVINATGVWADDIMEMDEYGHKKMIRPSQGIHLVLDRSFLKGDHALMIPKTSDGRVLFAVPWHDHLVIGTTDTPVDENSEEPKPLESEVEFILDTASAYLTKKVTRKDVLSVFAGLRPLAAPGKDKSKTKEISRNHKILISKSGLVTVIGGKWTTYRRMGEEMVDAVEKLQQGEKTQSISREFLLASEPVVRKNDHLSMYGNNAADIRNMIRKVKALGNRIHPSLPYTKAEVIWITRNEHLIHLDDMLSRRLRILLLNARVAKELAPVVADIMAKELGWNERVKEAEVSDFLALADGYILQ